MHYYPAFSLTIAPDRVQLLWGVYVTCWTINPLDNSKAQINQCFDSSIDLQSDLSKAVCNTHVVPVTSAVTHSCAFETWALGTSQLLPLQNMGRFELGSSKLRFILGELSITAFCIRRPLPMAYFNKCFYNGEVSNEGWCCIFIIIYRFLKVDIVKK